MRPTSRSSIPFLARAFAAVRAVAALLVAVPLAAQDDAALRERVLAALGEAIRFGGRPGIIPADGHCPRCGDALRRLRLREDEPGIDSAAKHDALVCERDALFFGETLDVMSHGESGPFALPAAGEAKVATWLPFGARPIPRDAAAASFEDGEDGELRLVTPRGVVHRSRHEFGVTSTAIAANASLAAYARSAEALHVLDVARGRERARLALRGANLTALAIAPDGRALAYAIADGRRTRLESADADLRERHELAHWPGELGIVALHWTRDGRQVLLAEGEGRLAAWPLPGFTPKGGKSWHAELGRGIECVASSTDGAHVIATLRGGSRVVVLDARDGAIVRDETLATDARGPSFLGSSLACADDGSAALVALADGRLALVPLAAGGTVRRSLGALGIASVAFDGSGTPLSFDREGTAFAWDPSRFLPKRP